MNEPYKLIEKEFTWDEFYDILKQDDQIIRIIQRYSNGYIFQREYDWLQRRVRFSDDMVEFCNGGQVDFNFKRQFNDKILYGFGSFYLYQQKFDTIELEETEEVWLMDGMVEDRPIIKKMDTFTLQEREVKIYEVKKFA